MSYVNKINRELAKLFVKLGDLAVDGTFVRKAAGGFNFAAAEPTTVDDVPIVFPLVVTETKTKKSTVTKTILVTTPNLGAVADYSSVSFEGASWNFDKIHHEYKGIVLVDVTKG